MIRFLAILVALSVTAAAAEKPILFIVHSDACLPCRVFDKVFCDRPDFRRALQDAYDLRELDWDVPAQRNTAVSMGVDRFPAYLAWRNGRLFARHVGFATKASEIDDQINSLMVSLRIEWPPARKQEPLQTKPKQLQAPQPVPRPGAAAAVDSEARDAIARLSIQSLQLQAGQTRTEQQVESLQSRVSEIRSEVARSHTDIRTQLDSTSNTTRERIETIQQTLQQALTQPGTPPPDGSSAPGTATLNSGTPDPGPLDRFEPPAFGTPGPTASKWMNVIAWAGRTALTIAAPEFAIPGSLGLTAAGLALRWLHRRRQPAALGSVQNPIRVADPAATHTETKFVVHETDVLGESFKEAIRRVGNAHREQSPDVIEILKQVDAAATQLAHGRRMSRRPAVSPASENAP